ncbi:hypothetical protein C8Q77DRAFT_1111806 [Trametes polyzona]|nr:hypothetical protein C8Q77DRAFT_1111742 [Trametes polyzona]KAI0634413.1 hypothetical protein C8Q77DRAFT_1111806 [Trametes polyzona]
MVTVWRLSLASLFATITIACAVIFGLGSCGCGCGCSYARRACTGHHGPLVQLTVGTTDTGLQTCSSGAFLGIIVLYYPTPGLRALYHGTCRSRPLCVPCA